jgi:ribosomal silencing factor RsfS
VHVLTTVDLASMKTNQIAALTTNQIVNGLSTDQLVSLTTAQVAALTTAQVASLSTDHVHALSTADVLSMKSSQIAALTTDQISAGLTTDQIAVLTTAQVTALSTKQIVALTTDQVAALQTSDVVALKTSQIAALTTSQIAYGLSTTQVAALTTGQVEALTSSQMNALSTEQFTKLHLGSPIVIDLNGDGVHTRSIKDGVQFDLFATGQKTSTGWVDTTDGLLSLDRNGNGTIDSGAELFGTSTVLANGQKAANGYAALKELDTNGDGKIDSKDAAYGALRVWVDGNGDGVSQQGELRTLAALNIASVSVNADKATVKDNGNWIGLQSNVTHTDGSTAATGDVWFTAQTPAAAAPVTDNLRTRVGGLVQAMAAFNAGGSSTAPALTLPDATGGAPKAGLLAAVGSMVDVLKQFDANGGKLPTLGATLSSSAESLARSVSQHQDNSFLTTNRK